MPSLPGKRGDHAGLAFGSRGNHRKLSEEMKRGSRQWKKVLEGMKRECQIFTTRLLCATE
jgi:hypothetical protein